MSRIPAVDPAVATGKTRTLLEKVHGWFGATPQMFRVAAKSPAALEALVGFFGAASTGALAPGLREQLALAVAERNGCDYCLSAHSALGTGAGLRQEDLDAARDGRASAPKPAAALAFALAVLESRGHVADSALSAARAAGLSDGELVEVVAHVALNVFTNFLNSTAGTEVDFPRVTARRAA